MILATQLFPFLYVSTRNGSPFRLRIGHGGRRVNGIKQETS